MSDAEPISARRSESCLLWLEWPLWRPIKPGGATRSHCRVRVHPRAQPSCSSSVAGPHPPPGKQGRRAQRASTLPWAVPRCRVVRNTQSGLRGGVEGGAGPRSGHWQSQLSAQGVDSLQPYSRGVDTRGLAPARCAGLGDTLGSRCRHMESRCGLRVLGCFCPP